ncbi:MAG TPA: hybrid sensor histidine kinase/response regulator [Rudaea sp.]
MIADESAARIVVRCLIVDDLEANLLSLAALLRSDDVEVITARSGVEALELLLASDVALALIDVQMPEMDGFELAELIRGSERTRHIPLIFVTAGERQERRMFEGYESGAVDFLYKPIDAQILRSKAEVFFQLDRQRQQLARELETKSENLRLNELFLGVLGHDLRNPLTTVLTSAEYLRQSDDPKIAKFGGWIHASGERMSRLIEDTLDLVRMRVGGGIQLHAAAMDMGDVVGRIVDEQRAAHPDRQFTFQRDGNLSGIWDADRVAQVASNLIGNAARHGTAGSAITIDARGSDSAVVLTVANQGSIAPELLPCIFDPFRGTRDRHRGRYGGLGLGLYIVQQVVLAHGGRIDIRTTDDTTTFIVDLPHPAAGGASGPKRRNAEI